MSWKTKILGAGLNEHFFDVWTVSNLFNEIPLRVTLSNVAQGITELNR